MTFGVKQQLAAALLFGLLVQPLSAADEVELDETAPDIELLEFLGAIAGLESMGVDIDELLTVSAAEVDEEDMNESDTVVDESERGEHNG